MDRQDFRFAHRLRVRWAEVDRQDIVFNAHYLTYFDVAMTEYLRAVGFRYPDELLALDSDLFLVKATVEYKSPALYDDELDCHVRVGRIGNSSLQFLFALYRGDERLVDGGEHLRQRASEDPRKQPGTAAAARRRRTIRALTVRERGDQTQT